MVIVATVFPQIKISCQLQARFLAFCGCGAWGTNHPVKLLLHLIAATVHPSIFCPYPVLDRRASSLSRDARTCDMNVITLSSTCPWNLPWSTSCSVPIQAPHYFNPQPALLSVKQMLLMLTFRLSWGVTKPGLYRLAVVRSGIVTYQRICWDGVKIGTFLCSKHINVVWLAQKV